jgi:hypothetical protein
VEFLDLGIGGRQKTPKFRVGRRPDLHILSEIPSTSSITKWVATLTTSLDVSTKASYRQRNSHYATVNRFVLNLL